MAVNWNDIFAAFVRATDEARLSAGKVTKVMSNFQFALQDLHTIGEKLTNRTDDYQTATRNAIRGTSQLTSTVSDLTDAYWNNVASGNEYAMAAGATAEEGVRMATMMEEAARGAAINTAGHTDDIRQYMEKASQYVLYTGMQTEEAARLGSSAVRELGMSFRDAEKLLSETGTAAEVFGLNGSKAFEALQKEMSTIQGMEQADRLAYARKLLRSAGMQEKAVVDFGRYTDKLTGGQGVESLKSAAILAQLSGFDPDRIADAVANPKGEGHERMLMEAQLEASRRLVPDFEALNAAVRAGRATADETQRYFIGQEVVNKTLGEYFNTDARKLAEIPDRLRAMDKAMASDSKAQPGKYADRAAELDAAGVRDAADQLKTQAERDRAWKASVAETLGVQNKLTDGLVDAVGVFRRSVLEMVADLQQLYGATHRLGVLLWMLAGGAALHLPSILGGLGSLLGGLGSLGASLLAAAGGLKGLAKGAWAVSVAYDAGTTLMRLASEEGRKQLREEAEAAAEESQTTVGLLKNFAKGAVKPADALAKLVFTVESANKAMRESAELEKKAAEIKARNEKRTSKLWADARATQDGKILAEAMDRANEIFRKEVSILSDEGAKNFVTPAALATALAEAAASGKSEESALQRVYDLNVRAAEAARTQDAALRQSVDAQIQEMQRTYDRVVFDHGALAEPVARAGAELSKAAAKLDTAAVSTADAARAQLDAAPAYQPFTPPDMAAAAPPRPTPATAARAALSSAADFQAPPSPAALRSETPLAVRRPQEPPPTAPTPAADLRPAEAAGHAARALNDGLSTVAGILREILAAVDRPGGVALA